MADVLSTLPLLPAIVRFEPAVASVVEPAYVLALLNVKLPGPLRTNPFDTEPAMAPLTVRVLPVLFVQVWPAPSETLALMLLSAAALEALSVMPPAPNVSVLAPPIVTAAVSSGVNVRLLIEKACPSTVFKLVAPNRLKNT